MMRLIVEYGAINNRHQAAGLDVNANHSSWGSTDNNVRSYSLLNVIAETNFVIIKHGCKPTFPQSKALTCRKNFLISPQPSAMQRVKKGSLERVLDDSAMTDHNYRSFRIGTNVVKIYLETLWELTTGYHTVRSLEPGRNLRTWFLGMAWTIWLGTYIHLWRSYFIRRAQKLEVNKIKTLVGGTVC